MSQQLGFILRSKANSEINLEAGWFSTTPARVMSTESNLIYTENEISIDEDFLKETLADLKDKLDSYIKSQASVEKKMQDLKETAYKCTSPDVVSRILEKIEDLQNDWDGYQAEIEDYQHYINKIEFISDLYSENKEDWNLYYYNC